MLFLIRNYNTGGSPAPRTPPRAVGRYRPPSSNCGVSAGHDHGGGAFCVRLLGRGRPRAGAGVCTPRLFPALFAAVPARAAVRLLPRLRPAMPRRHAETAARPHRNKGGARPLPSSDHSAEKIRGVPVPSPRPAIRLPNAGGSPAPLVLPPRLPLCISRLLCSRGGGARPLGCASLYPRSFVLVRSWLISNSHARGSRYVATIVVRSCRRCRDIEHRCSGRVFPHCRAFYYSAAWGLRFREAGSYIEAGGVGWVRGPPRAPASVVPPSAASA